jgi:hypothetical protein
MGQIDSEKMYTNVMKWDWGNSDSNKIYHDPKLDARVSLTEQIFRLMDQLIVERKFEKAKRLLIWR